jgi:GDP-L-fucose synthase
MAVSKMKESGWEAKITLEEGIRETYDWYLNHIGDLKKVRL